MRAVIFEIQPITRTELAIIVQRIVPQYLFGIGKPYSGISNVFDRFRLTQIGEDEFIISGNILGRGTNTKERLVALLADNPGLNQVQIVERLEYKGNPGHIGNCCAELVHEGRIVGTKVGRRLTYVVAAKST